MNQRKGNLTPCEAFGGTADWEAMVARVKAFKNPGKLVRFVAEEIDDDFAARQLVDTSYASRLAGQYLARLYGLSQPTACDADGVQRIQFGNGRITGLLRQQWGLNSILAAPTAERDSPEIKERFDHRHHAIDAVVVAMTSPRIVQQLAQAAERAERQGRRGFVDFSPPWPTFRGDIGNAIKNIVVSHRVARRVNGQFHKETRYGTPDAECLPVHHRVRHRVPLVKLSSERVGRIVDPVVRQRVEDRLSELGETNPSRAFQSEANFPFLCARNGRQIPIRSVRIEENLTVRAVGEGHRRRLVQLADNHHIEIFAVPNRRGQITWEGRIVSLIDARQRLLRGQPIIDREPRDFGPQATFLFSLSKGESVLVADADFPDPLTAAPVSNGESPPPMAVWVVTGISDGQLEFERHHDGTPAALRRLSQANAARADALTDEQRAIVALRQSRGIGQRIYKSPSALRGVSARKITITPLGQIRWAND